MSEAELHHIKMRLEAGRRFKAARGELQQGLPAGLERLRNGEVILSPDEEVQSRLRLVFDKFRETMEPSRPPRKCAMRPSMPPD
jgi:hypothetical protein